MRGVESVKPFSVAMCVYGGDNPAWFAAAVDSVIRQTVAPDEIVIVVDGPVPAPLDAVIGGYESDPLFKVIRLAENRGHGEARRIGLQRCTHDVVALMDADDLSRPNRFEMQLPLFDGGADAVGGQISEFVGTPANVVGKRVVPVDDAAIKEYIKKRCPMNQVTVMLRKSAVEQVGGYIDWYCEEDYYLWVRMHLAGMTFANLPDVLVDVRVDENTYRRRGGWRYFQSEAKLQGYMLKKGVIGLGRYLMNVTQRLVLQVLIPHRLRGWIFKRFARSDA
jgi:glycosyltransferase involved in cell wall biosynthesis